MGNSFVTSAQQKKFDADYRHEMNRIDTKFQKFERLNVLCLGPPQAGKTALIKGLQGIEVDEQYVPDEVGQLGIEVFTPIKSTYKNLMPVSMHFIDTPGNLIQTSRASDYYFEQADVILICIDITLSMDEEKIDAWTQFTTKMVSKHHKDFLPDEEKLKRQNKKQNNNDCCGPKAKKDFGANRVSGPLILHVFTKQDRVQEMAQKRNDRQLKN